MSTQAPLRGGELNAAVTSALVGIQNEYLGRGPKTERLSGRSVIAFISGNHVSPDIAAELFILDEPL